MNQVHSLEDQVATLQEQAQTRYGTIGIVAVTDRISATETAVWAFSAAMVTIAVVTFIIAGLLFFLRRDKKERAKQYIVAALVTAGINVALFLLWELGRRAG